MIGLSPKQEHKKKGVFLELKINKLRGRMGELGINMTQLAERAGLTRHCVRYVLTGKKKTRIETAVKICRALYIDESKLLEYFPQCVPETSTKEEEK